MMRNASITTDTFNISSRGMTSGPEVRGAVKDDFSGTLSLISLRVNSSTLSQPEPSFTTNP